MTTDYRALCAELVDALDSSNGFFNSDGEWVVPEPIGALVARARALLDTPERVAPTDLRDETLLNEAEVAAVAMEEAMRQRAVALPQLGNKPYTAKQGRLIEQFRQDMAATGALVPAYWTHVSAREIGQAGIDAVREAAGHG